MPRATLKVLRENGLRLLLVGYESGNQQILHNIKKGMRIEVAKQFSKDCHELGIKVHGTFIVGLPGETRETIQESIAFAKEVNPHTMQVSLAAPYPGTFLHKQATENGWLDAANAELIDENGVQIAPLHYPHLSHTEIFDSVEVFYRKFYFRAPKIASIVGEMVRSPADDEAPPARRRGVLPVPARPARRLAPAGTGFARTRSPLKRVLFSADDFGLSLAVNEGIERAHRDGVLSTASLMVAGPAAGDAVTRARRLPGLRVGLHLVTIEGPPALPRDQIPALLDQDGSFPSDQLRLGLRYAFHPTARRQLAREIAAQFDAFAATGLHPGPRQRPQAHAPSSGGRPHAHPGGAAPRAAGAARSVRTHRPARRSRNRVQAVPCGIGPGCCGTRRAGPASPSTTTASASPGAAT